MATKPKKATNKPRKEPKKRGKSIFDGWAGKSVRVPISLREENPIKYVPHFIYVTFFGLLYIANSHYSEKRLIEIAKLEQEINKIAFDYKSIRYEFMKKYEYDQVVAKARRMGLRENDKPLIKVKLIKD